MICVLPTRWSMASSWLCCGMLVTWKHPTWIQRWSLGFFHGQEANTKMTQSQRSSCQEVKSMTTSAVHWTTVWKVNSNFPWKSILAMCGKIPRACVLSREVEASCNTSSRIFIYSDRQGPKNWQTDKRKFSCNSRERTIFDKENQTRPTANCSPEPKTSIIPMGKSHFASWSTFREPGACN